MSSDINYKIENIVVTIDIKFRHSNNNNDGNIDLSSIADKFGDVEYNPARFPGLIMRFINPRATVLLFSTGKMVCTGMRSKNDIPLIIKLIRANLEKFGLIIDSLEYTIQNIVSTTHFGCMIDLNTAAVAIDNSLYEPEVFPGLICRIQNPKSVFLIFSTGKAVCTGIRNDGDLDPAVRKMKEELEKKGLIIHKDENVEYEEEFEFL